MRAVVWFRIASILLLLFAVGHTFGFLSFQPSTAEGRAVWTAMNDVHFSVGHSTFSYGAFYKGFGLSITGFQLFMAWLAWQLGSMAKRGVMDARVIAWGIVGLQIVGAGLALRYFSVAPALFSVATLFSFVAATVSMRRQPLESGL
ncbi:MAG: hypothetical protein ABI286_00325 [Edaphobacter sp.]